LFDQERTEITSVICADSLTGLHPTPKLVELLLQLDVLGIGLLNVKLFLKHSGAFSRSLKTACASGTLSLAKLSERLLDDFGPLSNPLLQFGRSYL
jgi:hypothetical protein